MARIAYNWNMTITEIKTRVHQRIEHLSEAQIKKLYTMMDQEFPEGIEKPNKPKKRQLGTMPGLVKYMAPDFNEPLEDFKEYMPE
uniref:DUF2281 domain-containing protein n=1 Tax=Roseihalotalea indica TaxID=2867963 RepID=A0AA49JIC6_9BACT|nr:DUF2281 domain-containing protein [Tunicatimonas sp. TK19036]